MIATRPSRTVIVRLIGGLGNQMFQYAIGRQIAVAQRRRLVLDDLALQASNPAASARAYSLNGFRISPALTSQSPVDGLAMLTHIVQQARGFHPEVLKPSPFRHVYLHGFWQHEGYFTGIRTLLREEFRFRTPLRSAGEWRMAIQKSRAAVCVHVRRQDYLQPSGGRFGFVGGGYYERAFKAMTRRVSGTHFFVFSDDVPWCRRNLAFVRPCSFIDHSGSPDDDTLRDFSLMTMCRHFIIANSSFSWWAAWLGFDPRKTVIAPKAWFRDRPSDSAAITPSRWLRL